jgi:hypothetical protein
VLLPPFTVFYRNFTAKVERGNAWSSWSSFSGGRGRRKPVWQAACPPHPGTPPGRCVKGQLHLDWYLQHRLDAATKRNPTSWARMAGSTSSPPPDQVYCRRIKHRGQGPPWKRSNQERFRSSFQKLKQKKIQIETLHGSRVQASSQRHRPGLDAAVLLTTPANPCRAAAIRLAVSVAPDLLGWVQSCTP